MSTFIFLAILFAALLHASWNALVKSTPDKMVAMTAITIGHAPLPLLALPFLPAPAPESWPWIAGSVIAHAGYQLFLIQAYRLGDYTQVYPIARGAGPAIVAAVSVGAMGVALNGAEIAGIILIIVGICALSLARGADGLRNAKAVGAALVTGCFIAAYSLLDGLGARIAGTAVGYIAWLTIFNALVFAMIIGTTRPPALKSAFADHWKLMAFGGAFSVTAYVIVVWAMTQAPIALVTALRETSTIFALLIGVVFLGEKVTAFKIAAVLLALCGAALLKLAA